jgi:hypothetical protein
MIVLRQKIFFRQERIPAIDAAKGDATKNPMDFANRVANKAQAKNANLVKKKVLKGYEKELARMRGEGTALSQKGLNIAAGINTVEKMSPEQINRAIRKSNIKNAARRVTKTLKPLVKK